MYEDRTILIDASKYQPSLDYRILASNGVAGIIAKISQGDYILDPKRDKHLKGAHSNLMLSGGYHWLDPMRPVKAQIDHFISGYSGLPCTILALDVEQYWQEWSEWALHNITKRIPSKQISQWTLDSYEYLRSKVSNPIMIYTRTSFIKDHAPHMLEWLPSWTKENMLWLAAYPYAYGTTYCTWEEFKTTYYPKIDGPRLPLGVSDPAMWQCSGDRFILPGTGGKKIDINLWPGTAKSLLEYAKYNDVPPLPPPPTSPQLPALVELQYSLKTHKMPDTLATSVNGGLNKGVLLMITELAYNATCTMGRVSPNLWVALESKGVKLAVWV